jgi:hypothetical protein
MATTRRTVAGHRTWAAVSPVELERAAEPTRAAPRVVGQPGQATAVRRVARPGVRQVARALVARVMVVRVMVARARAVKTE